MTQTRFTFPKRMRLTRGKEFLAVRNRGVRANAGPLLVYGLANGLGYPRLGLGVSARVGNAVRRNAIKRRLREAFRHGWREWPTLQPLAQPDAPVHSSLSSAYDVVISVRAHEALHPEEYQRLLLTALREIDATCRKKRRHIPATPAAPPSPAPPRPHGE